MNARLKAGVLVVAILSGQSGCRKQGQADDANSSHAAYDSEPDWTDSQKIIPLNYQQAQGKRIFYQYCVWCHADVSPAGPSNRSNLTPIPVLLNDGTTLNPQTDEYLRNIITLGGSALGKSSMMPPYGRTLSPNDIGAVIAFTRAIAQPAYEAPPRSSAQRSTK
jgi:hypothetical protein